MPRQRSRSRASQRASLSLEQIVATAIDVLDRDGIRGLTLRGLAAELGGGLGSIYWYVKGKDELIELASDALILRAMDLVGQEPGDAADILAESDDEAIVRPAIEARQLALALFSQMEAHPWLAQARQWQGGMTPASLRYWEQLGRRLAEMGLTPRQQFNGSTAVSGYVTGIGAEVAVQDRHADALHSKDEQLSGIAQEWLKLDPEVFTWLPTITEEFRTHDDREQFTAGLDLLVVGLVRQAAQRR